MARVGAASAPPDDAILAPPSRRDPHWTIFWYGLPDWATVQRAVEYARGRRPTLAG